MYPQTHAIFGFVVSILIWFIFPALTWWQIFIIFASSVLIDFDHYLLYAIKKHDWNLRRAYQWHVKKFNLFKKISEKKRNKFKNLIIIFHGIEFWLFLTLLMFVSDIFFFVLIGIIIHMVLDYIDMYRWKVPFYSKTSQIVVLVKNKKKKKLIV